MPARHVPLNFTPATKNSALSALGAVGGASKPGACGRVGQGFFFRSQEGPSLAIIRWGTKRPVLWYVPCGQARRFRRTGGCAARRPLGGGMVPSCMGHSGGPWLRAAGIPPRPPPAPEFHGRISSFTGLPSSVSTPRWGSFIPPARNLFKPLIVFCNA